MKEFIAASKEAKNSLHMANIASSMPVNVLITGPRGVGKKLLAKVVAHDGKSYDALEFSQLIKGKTVDLNQLSKVVLYNIDGVKNISQLIEQLEQNDVQIIATSDSFNQAYLEKFLVKIELSPLQDRPEDVEILKQHFLKEAKETFFLPGDTDESKLRIDLSQNAISLKESIYKSLLFNNLKKDQVMDIVENYLVKTLEEENDYKELLELFEVPLLKAAKKRFKSQLQMSKRLRINRVTLRKKLAKYDLD